jgi:hypothetical protein
MHKLLPQVIVKFGNTSAIKEISLYRDNKSMLNELVSSIFIIRVSLLPLILFQGSYLFWPQAREIINYFALSMWASAFMILFSPVWYFQGVEK